MELFRLNCLTCGAALEKRGERWICLHCGNEYVIVEERTITSLPKQSPRISFAKQIRWVSDPSISMSASPSATASLSESDSPSKSAEAEE